MHKKKITLIQCTDSKRPEPAAAKDLYDESKLFRKMRAYAEAKDCPWAILSAKHGLLRPDTHIEPYDAYGLSEKQAIEIASVLSDDGVTSAEIIAGKSYTNPLTPELESKGIDVVETCRGMGIGEREQRLVTLTRKLENSTLQAY